jgi:NADH-quinone oxidoreductase subunit G
LCPVGALTSKPYAFTARSWELRYLRSLDLFDSIGLNISIYFRGNKIMRILPFPNAQFDDFWLTDRTRFFYDGLNVQRLESPLIKLNGIWLFLVGVIRLITFAHSFYILDYVII